MEKMKAHYHSLLEKGQGARRLHVHLTELDPAGDGWLHQHSHAAEEAIYIAPWNQETTHAAAAPICPRSTQGYCMTSLRDLGRCRRGQPWDAGYKANHGDRPSATVESNATGSGVVFVGVHDSSCFRQVPTR